MSILVTGGAGYIGSHVVRQLRDAGHEVVIFDNLSTGHADMVLGGGLIEGDLADAESLNAAFSKHRIDAVMHFAASTIVGESVEKPIAYYQNNTANTIKLLAACERFDVGRFIFSSTGAVYGESAQSPIAETALPDPINPYGASKTMSERIIADCAAAYGMSYVIIRYFIVAGADPGGRIGPRPQTPTLLIPLALQAALGLGKGLTIFGDDYPTPDGTGIRDYIHVEDIALAHLDALHFLQSEKRSITVNCGYGHGHSVRQVIDMVRSVAGTDFPVAVGPRRPGDPPIVVADSSMIRQTLGWIPQFDDLETIVKHAYQWEQARLADAAAGTHA